MEDILVVKGLSKVYNKKPILNNVSFSLEKGKIYGIVGENGSGKSTLIQCVLGLIPYEMGTVTVLGKEIKYNRDRKFIFSHCRVVLQEMGLPKRLRVSECLELFATLGGDLGEYKEIIKMLRLEKQLNKEYNQLSYGQKQKVLIATAFLQKAEISFLDEPTNGLDRETREEVIDFILELKKSKNTIILVSHQQEEIRNICDGIIFIDEGKIRMEETFKENENCQKNCRND